jgi:predicted nucleic acid-binding protein
MSTAIDTNVIVSLWSREPELSTPANNALEKAAAQGALVVSAPVFAELMASPGFAEDDVAEFCAGTGIEIEWQITEKIWREAGRAYHAYARRRRRSGDHHPRRILADFLIGAHALINGYALLTMDKSVFHTAFPALRLLTF